MTYLFNYSLPVYVKRLFCSLLIMSGFVLQSCETEIPVTDSIPPAFSFRITGDGLNHTFTQADDFSRFQLNLKTGVSYNFIYTGSDAGGLKTMRLQFPFDYLVIESPIESPWTSVNSGLSQIVSWRGDPLNPITGSVITGTFRTETVNSGIDIKFSLEDYGGRSATVNSTYKQLNILIGQFNSEIIYF